MKRIYNIIKYPLIFIFLKTPLINILKKRFKYHRFRKNSFFGNVLDHLFQKEYFNKLKNKEEIRELINSSLEDGEGRKWAEHYFNNHFQTLQNLKKKRVGKIFMNEASLIFEKMINFIQVNNFSSDQNTWVIQLGSSSGRDIEFFLKIFPKLSYISTDINDEILNFQKRKYNYTNLKYFKCHAEDVDKCINYFNIKNKNIILFSSGSLQYVSPYFLEVFFKKIKNYKNINLFINENVSISFIDNQNEIYDNRGNISFSYRYDQYVKNFGINLVDYKIIKPYSKNDKLHFDTGHFYLHANT